MATARFTRDAVVNLSGSGIDLKPGTGLTLVPDVKLVITNGTLNANHKDTSDFGVANATVVFGEGATLARGFVNPVAGMTVVFEGGPAKDSKGNDRSKVEGRLRPWDSNARIDFLNSELTVSGVVGGRGWARYCRVLIAVTLCSSYF